MSARGTVPRVRLEAGVRGTPHTLVHIEGVDIELARRHLGPVSSEKNRHFRNKGHRKTYYLSESGMERIGGAVKSDYTTVTSAMEASQLLLDVF